MDQSWFEMPEIRRRRLSNAVWIPLRQIQTLQRSGEYGRAGFKEEFLGIGTIAAYLDKKAQAEVLGWGEIGTNYAHHSTVERGCYIPCDAYSNGKGEVLGLHLVLEQRFNSEDPPAWHLHHDLVVALKLMKEEDSWLAPDEGYVEVARLKRDGVGRPVLMEVRSEHLKDYLCARCMYLHVTSYRHRTEISDKPDLVRWDNGAQDESKEAGRWEGRMTQIHEGGGLFEKGMSVLHVGRTDVDPAEDVPRPGFPADGAVVIKSWHLSPPQGRKLYRVEGELWRDELLEAGDLSPRILSDEVNSTVFYVTTPSGTRESSASLRESIGWLWFRPKVMLALLEYRGGSLGWYTRDTGSVRCAWDDPIHFGINRLGLVNVFAKDIALLPEWQQKVWSGFNVGPEGGVSEELLAAQMKSEPATTQAPESFLERGIKILDQRASKLLDGRSLFRPHDQYASILKVTHRFRATNQRDLYALAKDLVRLTADSIDEAAVKRIVTPPKGEKWGSLKALENLIATKVEARHAHSLMSPLFGLYELRIADAHLASDGITEALQSVGVESSLPFVTQGYQLIAACVGSLYALAEAFAENKEAAAEE
jgi:hypothetical protein